MNIASFIGVLSLSSTVLIGTVNAQQPPSFTTNGLVGYYPFNGNTKDASGRGHDGTNYGAQISVDRFGNPNSAILLDGQSACVEIPYSTDFDFAENGQFSLTAWFKINGGGSGYRDISAILVKCPRQGPSDFYGIWDYGMCAYWETEPTLWAGLNGRIAVTSQDPVKLGVWQQGIVTYSNANWRLYLNGVLVSQNQTPYTITRSTGGLAIGRKGDVPLDHFNGSIDDVRIYNRALSETEVHQLYAYEAAPAVQSFTNGLVAYYPFNGNTKDASGRGHDGTNYGAQISVDRFGNPNSAILLDGQSSSVGIPYSSDFDFAGDGQFSLTAWFKIPNDGFGYHNVSALLVKCPRQNPTDFYGFWDYGMYAFYNNEANFWAGLHSRVPVISPNPVQLGVWQQGIVTYSNANWRLYLNGVLVSQNQTPYTITRSTGGLAIGRKGDVLIDYFKGSVDDVRIYNRALSENEVHQLYAYEAAPAVQPFTNGLVAYYPFNGNTKDASGHGHDGTNYGAQISVDRFGNPDSAILLDGKSACVGIPYSTDFDFAGDGQFSMAAWFKINGGGSGYRDIGSILMKCPRQGPSDFYGIWDYGMCAFYENQANIWAGLHDRVPVISPQPVQLDVWQQATVTYSNANWRLYLNGVLVSQNQTPYTITRSTGGLAIGRKGDVPIAYFNGSIDDVRIYNRALSSSEVQGLYAYEAPTSTGPSIKTQPQPVTVNVHGYAYFKVVASGSGPLSYQWALNGTNILGAKSDSLVLTNVLQTHLGKYTVTVSSPYGKVTSSNAVLSMRPFIETPFTGTVAYWGKDTKLSVKAGGSSPLTYQWFKNGTPVLNATNSTLNITNVQFTNAGRYSVVIRNPFGSVVSSAAQLVVNPAGVSIGMYAGVMVSGVVGYTYTIQSTTNLFDSNSWATATTMTLVQPEQLWIDVRNNTTSPTNHPRFYRVVPGQ